MFGDEAAVAKEKGELTGSSWRKARGSCRGLSGIASSEPQSCKEHSGAVVLGGSCSRVDAADVEGKGKLTAKEAIIRSQGPSSGMPHAVDLL